jgi:hypothetical protein
MLLKIAVIFRLKSTDGLLGTTAFLKPSLCPGSAICTILQTVSLIKETNKLQ